GEGRRPRPRRDARPPISAERGLGRLPLVLVAVLVEPAIHFLLGLLPAPAVSLLDLADQLLVVTLHLVDVVTRELAPLLPNLALDLRPLPLQEVAVQLVAPSLPVVSSSPGGVTVQSRRPHPAGPENGRPVVAREAPTGGQAARR